MPAVRFEITARDSTTAARAGILHTPHGAVPTPAFAPVGTQGAVKALAPRDLTHLGVTLLMTNAYHLAMRPGAATVVALGGVHAVSGWSGPIIADSGGFQAFSLGDGVRRDTDGITVRYPVDGSVHRLTPESVVALQEQLGPDVALPLDVCTPYPATRDQASEDLAVTVRWASLSQAHRQRDDQAMYAIVQGATFPDLRAESARAVSAMGFDGFAVGGVSVGEPKSAMIEAIEASVADLPEDRPRHLLGLGHPEDLVMGVERGIDTFDCVMPTRVARNAGALTMQGRLNLRNAAFAEDPSPVASDCTCYACRRFSRGAIRHFLNAGEILGLHLLTLHNLHFTLSLVSRIRDAVVSGSFPALRDEFLAAYAGGRFAPAGPAREFAP